MVEMKSLWATVLLGIGTVKFAATHPNAHRGVQVVTYPVQCPVKCNLPYKVEIPNVPRQVESCVPYVVDRNTGKSYQITVDRSSHSSQYTQDSIYGEAKRYDFQAHVPIVRPPEQIIFGCKPSSYQRLRGLKTRVDKALMPACDYVCA